MRNENEEMNVERPGVYIIDAIEALGLSQKEFSARSGIPEKTLSTLLNGESNVTFQVAEKLASFFHNSRDFWINLQTSYEACVSRQAKRACEEEDARLLRYFDKEFLRKTCGVDLSDKRKTLDTMESLFMVGSLSLLKKRDMFAFCKTSVSKGLDEKQTVLRNAWISLAMYKAQSIKVQDFDEKKISASIKNLRGLTRNDPRYSFLEIKRVLSECGVKYVELPYLKGSNMGGVTKWLPTENCFLLAINDCAKRADHIWFSFFHELGHVVQGDKRHLTISVQEDETNDEQEQKANNFAEDAMIDRDDYAAFVDKKAFSLASIKSFSSSQGVAAFIVVGRLEKDGYLPWSSYPNIFPKYVA